MTNILKLQKEAEQLEELIVAVDKASALLKDRYADVNYALSEYAAVQAEMEAQDGEDKEF